MENQCRLEPIDKAKEIADELIAKYDPADQVEIITVLRLRIMEHIQACIESNKQRLADLKKLK